MSTAIEWTDETWNPVVGCTKVSQGCKNCYAKTLHDKRHKAALAGKAVHPQYLQPFETVQLMPDRLDAPLHWRKPRRVFVNSVSDLFHEDVPDEFLDRVFAVMALAHWHVFQVLTKRPQRMLEYLTAQYQPATNPPQSVGDDRHARIRGAIEEIVYGAHAEHFNRGSFSGDRWWTEDGRLKAFHASWPLPNVWLGVSVENQDVSNDRIEHLIRTPAAVRFLSCEPLLGPLEIGLLGTLPKRISPIYSPLGDCIDWVIVGGESGPRARVCDVQWIRAIVEECEAADVPCFVKQLGSQAYDPTNMQSRVNDLHDRKGGNPAEWPEDLRVREYPAAKVSA